jgi:two-component system chemotaxis response regulator CheB
MHSVSGGPAPTRVLIVDDSPTIRRLMRRRFDADPRLLVVGEARDPVEARHLIKALNPHVLTLDIEMPNMNGLDFLERLMRLRPMPVVMVSSQTQQGSAAAIEAMALGAVDCVAKPREGGLFDAVPDLCDLVFEAGRARLQPPNMRAPVLREEEERGQKVPAHLDASPRPASRSGPGIILIGASTGGVDAIETVLSQFPPDCPPTLITQHMPASFLMSFALRLSARVAPRVKIAEARDPLLPGCVYLAPGEASHLEIAAGERPVCRLSSGPQRNGHRPSVDVMFESAVPLAQRVAAVVLTGMGKDGAEGLQALRQSGARCFAQDAETSVVWGMPRAAIEIGAAEMAIPLQRIAQTLLGAVQTTRIGIQSASGQA